MRLAVRGVPKGALRTHSSQQASLCFSCRVLFTSAPVFGLCFFVLSVNVKQSQETNPEQQGAGGMSILVGACARSALYI